MSTETLLPEEVAAEVRRLELATRRLVRDLVAGNYASAFKGRGVEFADVRTYEPGDDVRAMDWRVTARLGIPHVRVRREERELALVIAVDVSASGDVGSRARTKRELALQVGTVLALAAARSNDRTGAAFLTDRLEHAVPLRKGRRHALRTLHELLSYRPAARGTDLHRALTQLEQSLRQRVVVAILSDWQSPDFHLPLARLARKHDVIGIQVVEPLERELPAAGLVTLRDPETGALVVADTDDPAVRAAYAAARRAFDDRVATEIVAAGADLLTLDASASFAEPLTAFFRRRARRR